MYSRIRFAAFAALLLLAALASPAAAQESRACLWMRLPIIDQMRLELAARVGDGMPKSLIERVGEGGLKAMLERCGMAQGEPELALMARYWMAKATVEVARIELHRAGVPPSRADGALLITAPPEQRAAMALEIIGGKDELAGPSIRAAVDTLHILGPPLTDEQRQKLAEYFSAAIIADGLEAGATPPVE